MDNRDVGLLDVVPWTHGYVHSWALRWMLGNDQRARDALLDLFVDNARRSWAIDRDGIVLEHRVGRPPGGPVRTSDRRGEPEGYGPGRNQINDAIRKSQIETYCGERAEVVLYGPGLTGLPLGASDPLVRELATRRWPPAARPGPTRRTTARWTAAPSATSTATSSR